MSLTTILLAFIYRPWGSRLRSPFSYSGDSLHVAMLVKAMHFGWDYKTNPLVGAPYSASNYDFPVGGDRLHLILLKLISQAVRNPLIVLNIYFLVSFLLVSISMYAVLRSLQFRIILSLAGALLFTFAPYHFLHGPSHLFLSAYYSVPLIMYVISWSSRRDLTTPPAHVTGKYLLASVRRRSTWWLWLCLLVGGSASSYYAIFGMTLIGSVGITLAVRERSIRTLVRPAIAIAALGFVVLVSLSPEIIWNIRNGDNPQAAERNVAESEAYGLHLAQLVTPDPGHRIDLLSMIGFEARSVPAPGEAGTYIGLAAVVGIGFLAFTTVRRGGSEADDSERHRRRVAVLTAGWAMAIGTVGGIGMLLAVAGFTQIRAWGRISIFLLFVGIVGLLDLCAVVARRFAGQRAPLAFGVTALVTLALLDEIPAHVDFDSVGNSMRQDDARRFVATLDEALGDGAMVFQLPVTPYPEGGPVFQMTDYDHFRMPLADDGSLRWSYGGIRGRDTDWQARWASQEVRPFLAGLAAAGFQALYIDRYGYPDLGESYEAQVTEVVGPPIATDSSQRLAWFDLRPLQRREAEVWTADDIADLGSAVTRRVALWDLSDRPYDGRFESGDAIDIRNEGATSVAVRVDFTVRTGDGRPVDVKVSGKEPSVFSPLDGPQSIVVEAHPGNNVVTLSTDSSDLGGGDPADDLALDGLTISDVGLAEVLSRVDVAAATNLPADG